VLTTVGTVAALNSEHGQVAVLVGVNDQVYAAGITFPFTSAICRLPVYVVPGASGADGVNVTVNLLVDNVVVPFSFAPPESLTVNVAVVRSTGSVNVLAERGNENEALPFASSVRSSSE